MFLRKTRYKWKDGRTYGQTNRRPNGHTNGWTK